MKWVIAAVLFGAAFSFEWAVYEQSHNLLMHCINWQGSVDAMDVSILHPVEYDPCLPKTVAIFKMIRLFATVVSDTVNSDHRINIEKVHSIWCRKQAMHRRADGWNVSSPRALISNGRIKIPIKDDDGTRRQIWRYQVLYVLCAILYERLQLFVGR